VINLKQNEIKQKIEQINEVNKQLLKQLQSILSSYKFELTTNDFDLKYHTDLKVTLPNGKVEYWLMRFRNPPYRDFALRIAAKKYESEFDKIYNGNTISERYLHLVLNELQQIQEVYIINLKRLSNMKSFLDHIHTTQNKGTFVYITTDQLLKSGCIDMYIKFNEFDRILKRHIV